MEGCYHLPMRPTFILLILLLTSCSAPQGIEAEIAAVVEAAELAAEDRDMSDVMAHVHDGFTGRRAGGQGSADAADLRKMLAGYFLANQSVHVLTRIHAVEQLSVDLVRVDLAVAMARRPIDDPTALGDIRADLYRLDLALERVDGGWRVIDAEWQPAGPGDLL